ncbi:hypothetical protein STEG23_028705 [Scotinomys teguina]
MKYAGVDCPLKSPLANGKEDILDPPMYLPTRREQTARSSPRKRRKLSKCAEVERDLSKTTEQLEKNLIEKSLVE